MTRPNPSLNLLIVEDDENLAKSLKIMAPETFKIFIANSPSLVPDHVFFHAALVDMHLEVIPPENADGIGVIQKLSKRNPQTEIVAMSGNLDRKLMEKAIHAGAQRFLAKPLSAPELESVLGKIEALWALRLAAFEMSHLRVMLYGQSQVTQELRKKISMLRGEKAPVLIEGETGVGKDVVAQLLHQQEGARPFVSVNCSALTETLFESEFFGHLKGSFTGAESNKIGFAEAAHGGDLFLDEIEALPLTQQAKLLRFLESGEIRKVGAKETQKVEVRIISASNIPIKDLMAQKKFREDLYFRLNAHHILIPPLRERTEDIPDIAKSFLEFEKSKRNKQFEDSALSELKKYSWPGNVRELKRVCEQLSLTSPLPLIRDVDVQKWVGGTTVSRHATHTNTRLSLEDYLNEQEKNYIELILTQTNQIDLAAEKLKVSKSNLYKKIKDLGIRHE